MYFKSNFCAGNFLNTENIATLNEYIRVDYRMLKKNRQQELFILNEI